MKLSGRTAQRTLAWVNRIRDEYGRKPLKRLPKGRPHEPSDCPIARALHAKKVFEDEIRMNGVDVLTPPKYATEFIASFDAYRIPELIEE